MKKWLIGLLVVLLSILLLACSDSDPEEREPTNGFQQEEEQTNGEASHEDEDFDENEEEEEEEEPEELAFAEPKFDPITISGQGDSIEQFDGVGEAAIAHITGNSSSRHFAVKAYDAHQNYLDLLVNTTDAYDGIVLLDADTAEFEISATGAWEIEIRPLVNARSVGVNDSIEITDYNGAISGKNDEIILVVSDQDSTLVTINGNSQSRHFAVKGYGDSDYDLMVNTTDVYEGTVRLPKGQFVVLEITAVGEWEIAFE